MVNTQGRVFTQLLILTTKYYANPPSFIGVERHPIDHDFATE
ncbi:MAG: hypothetical protein ACRC2J_14605 [Microcoleaceae cyanobacterium]